MIIQKLTWRIYILCQIFWVMSNNRALMPHNWLENSVNPVQLVVVHHNSKRARDEACKKNHLCDFPLCQKLPRWLKIRKKAQYWVFRAAWRLYELLLLHLLIVLLIPFKNFLPALIKIFVNLISFLSIFYKNKKLFVNIFATLPACFATFWLCWIL